MPLVACSDCSSKLPAPGDLPADARLKCRRCGKRFSPADCAYAALERVIEAMPAAEKPAAITAIRADIRALLAMDLGCFPERGAPARLG